MAYVNVALTGRAATCEILPAPLALGQVVPSAVHVQALGNERGIVRISYYSTDDLERVLDLVLGKARSDFA